MTKFEGKIALVTGAGRGIGKAVALALAAAGADILSADIDLSMAEDTASEVEKLGCRAMARKVDVRDWQGVKTLLDQCTDKFGGLDILVNNAGVVQSALVETMAVEDWQRIMDTNVKGVFLCCKFAIPYLRRQPWGSIINIASVAGKNGVPTMSAYCASKFAVVGFTNALAKELAKTDITVNAVCPGIIYTAMWEYLAETFKRPGESIQESWERTVNTIPQGQAQTPEDIADLVLYLIKARHVTGQAINVDGGMELH
jgi:meso-butanediol dehydrogenase / (S,S)-butanediol dehydrogenase / diacetyl reductase